MPINTHTQTCPIPQVGFLRHKVDTPRGYGERGFSHCTQSQAGSEGGSTTYYRSSASAFPILSPLLFLASMYISLLKDRTPVNAGLAAAQTTSPSRPCSSLRSCAYIPANEVWPDVIAITVSALNSKVWVLPEPVSPSPSRLETACPAETIVKQTLV